MEREEFEKTPDERLSVGSGTNADDVLSFLSNNPDKAYTIDEIHEATGAVVWGQGLVRDERPWVVVNNSRHPFEDDEGVVVAVTTTERERAVPLDDGDFSEGGVPHKSYVPAWFVTTRKTTSLNERQGLLTDETFKRCGTWSLLNAPQNENRSMPPVTPMTCPVT